MGINPGIFNDMTVAEFSYAYLGYINKEYTKTVQQWELNRWLGWVLTSIQISKDERVSLKEMFPMPWDEEIKETKRELTIEERKKIVEKFKKYK